MLTIKEHITINQLIEKFYADEDNTEKCNEIADELIKMYPEYNFGYILKLNLISKTDDSVAVKELLDQLIDKSSFNLSLTYPTELLNTKDQEKETIFYTYLRSRAEYLRLNFDKSMNKTLFLKELFEIYDSLKDGNSLESVTKELITRDYNFLYIQRYFLGKDKEPHREKMNTYFKQYHDSMNEWNNTVEEKMEVFTKVFSEIKFNSASLKVSEIDDWDSHANSYIPKLVEAQNKEKFYELLVEMVNKVGDDHNNLSFPNDITKKYTNPGIWVIYIDGKYFVQFGLTYGEVQIKVGDEIVMVKGIETSDYIEENKTKYPFVNNYFFLPEFSALYKMSNKLLTFKKGETLNVEFKRTDGTSYSVEFSENIEKKEENISKPQDKLTSKMLDNDILLINIPAFRGNVYADFVDNVKEYDVNKIKGIVFDIRKNTGGNSGFGDSIFSHFISEEVKNYFMAYTKVHIPIHRFDGIEEMKLFDHVILSPAKDLKIKCPVAVLTSPWTGSAAEGFVVLFKYYNRGKIVGLPTSGSTGNPLFTLLKGGGFLRVNLNISMFFTCKGIEPDIYLENTISDLIKGNDSQLEKAIDYLRT